MPIIKKDEHSGALIFHLTDEEQSTADLKKELESMKKELSEKISKLDEVLASSYEITTKARKKKVTK